jgi:hypothetical protein
MPNMLLQIVSWAALAGSLLPGILYLNDAMTLGAVKTWMLISAVVWFATAPLWMDK